MSTIAPAETRRPTRGATPPPRGFGDARRTLVALLATALAVLPLRQLFTDWAWLPAAWTAMAITILPAAALRLRWAPSPVQLLPGVALVMIFLTHVYVPDHAVAGLLPFGGAWHDVSLVIADFGDTLRDGVAPVQSTPAIRLVLTSQIVLMALAVDLLAVVARRPALAGVPYLLVFTLAGAMPRRAVEWWWFVAAAIGYLMLLAADGHDELSRWGRVLPRVGPARTMAVSALSGRRIAVVTIGVAVLLPLIVPVRDGNVVADALHSGAGGGNGNGKSGRGQQVIGALAQLKGSLDLGQPVDLFTVQVQPGTEPFYARQQILDKFTGSGWTPSNNGSTENLDATQFGTVPSSNSPVETTNYTAKITISGLGGTPPTFQRPTSVSGLPANSSWSPRNEIVVGSQLRRGESYTENVSQPDPSRAVLESATDAVPSQLSSMTQINGVPASVEQQTAKLVAGKSTPYDKAVAIDQFFTDPANGFVYSTTTQAGDTGNDLSDFLENRTGFCQQYAAAMAVMLRQAGVPSRVVIGFTHSRPDGGGSFTVTTHDAHAWVEAYFAPIGWIPFDPTPLTTSSADVARAVPLPWATASSTTTAPTGGASSSTDSNPGAPKQSNTAAPSTTAEGGAQASSGIGWGLWISLAVVLLLLVLILVPAFARWTRRRGRLRAAARDPDPLWAELAATAIDLGYVWSPVRSPRQVVGWLRREGLPERAQESLRALAVAVEQARYAPPGSSGAARGELVGDLRDVESALRQRRNRGWRVRARLLPQSLGWSRLRVRGRH